MKKIIRINLNERSYKITEPSGPYRNLGGRGLTASIVAQEVPPNCDALGPDNKLVIAGGILAGTSVPNSGRISIGAKSPLTNTIKEANAGGSAAQKLARLGILALVLEGRADGLTTLKIDANGVTFQSAGDLPMVGNLDCIKYYRNRHGDGISIISIGPAGEMGLKVAAVSVTSPDFLPRMAARGGLGAVMGSKNVKAIVIDDADGVDVTIKDTELFKASVNAFTLGMTSHPIRDGLKHFETPLLVGIINEMGAILKIDDADVIARMNAHCNDIGVDPMDVGGALAVAMEAGRLPWGDGPRALAMVEEIARGTENGKMIGNGCRYTGEQLGVRRIPQVKGQAPVSQYLQRYAAAIDTLGVCLFASLPALDIPDLQQHLIDCTGAVLDESLGADYIMHLGAMVLNEECKFNLAAGQQAENDRLPAFFTEEALAPGGNTFDASQEELDRVHG